MLLCVARSFRAPLRASPLRRSLARSAAPRRIDSTKNDFVKLCKTLHRRKGREQTNLVFLEGQRLVGDALAAGAAPRTVLVADGVDADGLPGDVVRAPLKVVAACCDTSTPQGVVAVVEKPSLRAAMGATFRVPVVEFRDDGWAARRRGSGDWTCPSRADLAPGAEAYDAAPWADGGACVAVGAEVGVSRELAAAGRRRRPRVYIPMHADVGRSTPPSPAPRSSWARRQRAHNR
ncbi:RNA methyltransferase [Aureococcus anophagefferens]|nr:RNA methyltransferase [Aureococcus anophagefferens]